MSASINRPTATNILSIYLIIELLQQVLSMLFEFYLPAITSTLVALLVGFRGYLSKRVLFSYVPLILAALLSIGSFMSVPSLSAVLSTMRLWLVLPMLRGISSETIAGLRQLTYVLIGLMVAGVVGGESLVRIFGIADIYEYRGINVRDGQAIGWLTSIGSTNFHRAWSGFLAADKASYVSGFLITLWFAKYFNNRPILSPGFRAVIAFLLPVFFMQLILVKAALLAFGTLWLWWFISRQLVSVRILIPFFLMYLFIALLAIIILTNVPASVLSSSGAISHVMGFVNPWRLFTFDLNYNLLFGNGIGFGGTLGSPLNEHSDLHKSFRGGESYVGMVVYQFGIIGTLLIFSSLYVMVSGHSLRSLDIKVVFYSMVPVLIFSEAATSVVSILFVYLSTVLITQSVYSRSRECKR